ncbi:MAG: hypothetical protein R3314_06215 [Longimicrobiales bacterium]|nr:hypothetical protein [Longimicrobiales bacterium]
MEEPLSPMEKALFERCDEVLHYLWDPVGVAGVPQSRDEYADYVEPVFRFLRDDADRDAIIHLLLRIETDRLGLPGDEQTARATADALRDWNDWIRENVG